MSKPLRVLTSPTPARTPVNIHASGAPDFLQWVDSSAGLYTTKLFEAVFEYEQVWNKDWEKEKKDAMSFSVRVAA